MLCLICGVLPFNGWAQATFGPIQPLGTCESCSAWAFATGDADGDGDLDVFYVGEGLGWLENLDGQGTFGPLNLITEAITRGRDIAVGDVDGDNDLDIVIADDDFPRVSWFANTDGLGRFGPQQQITTSNRGTVTTLQLADINQDGALDLLTTGDRGAGVLYFNAGVGNFSTERPMGFPAQRAVDLNNDGYLDIAASSAFTHITTLLYDSNQEDFVEHYRLDSEPFSRDDPFDLATGDIDGDGAQDVLLAELGLGLGWFPNADGVGTFGERIPLPASARMIVPADVDADGDLDLIVDRTSLTGLTTIYWLENTDGAGTFEEQYIGELGTPTLHTADLNGDGLLDIVGLGAPAKASAFGSTRVMYWAAQAPDHTFAIQDPIPLCALCLRSSSQLADLDLDGDLDVVVTSEVLREVVWLENTGETQQFADPQVLLEAAVGQLRVADLDQDGDQDFVTWTDGHITWHENTGAFTFQPSIQVADSTRTPFDLADHDGDGDFDLLTTFSAVTDHAKWHAFADGAFQEAQRLPLGGSGQYTTLSGDVNGDGLRDLLQIQYLSSNVAWQASDGAWGTFAPAMPLPQTLNTGRAPYGNVIDLDSDGDLDVMVSGGTSSTQGGLYWFANIDGQGAFSDAAYLYQSVNFFPALSRAFPLPHFIDADSDGDLDIVSALIVGGTGDVHLMEHVDGMGGFSPGTFLDAPDYSFYLLDTGDVDGDGDPDVLGMLAPEDGALVWLENLTTSVSAEPLTKVSEFGLELDAVCPNPLHQDGTVTLRLATSQRVQLSVFDLLGREVASLHDGFLPAQAHTFRFGTHHWPNGSYILRASGERTSATQLFVTTR
ncbi:MAG: FG-GAP-like repeat-containing protein [Bacteroidota bacterium]